MCSNPKKILLILDFDYTITNQSSFKELKNKIEDQNILDEIKKTYIDLDFQKLFQIVINYLLEKGYTINDIMNNVFKIPLVPEMDKVFKYLSENSNIYDLYVISSNISSLIEQYLHHNNCNIFKAVIGYRDIINPEDNIYKTIPYEYKGQCDLCKKRLCKYNELINLIKNINDYQYTIFICDGINDYCLAKNLNENDKVYIRKNYGLHKKLINEKLVIKSQISYWENGKDIIHFLSKK